MKPTTNFGKYGIRTRRRSTHRRKIGNCFWLLLLFILHPSSFILSAPLVLQSDFGVKDGAVAAMKGVAVGVDPELKIYDLTHEIPAFNVWEGAYRLWQTAPYWPAGTVFVSVVDPGVGTTRKSVVARAKNGQYFVTPDNGTLTLIAEKLGLDAVREIDETKNRRAGSEGSYTFHGRDVYAYTGARLAAGVIKFEEVGPALDPAKVVSIEYDHGQVYSYVDSETDRRPISVGGGIPVLDPQYGNVWTNIDKTVFDQIVPTPKPGDRFEVIVTHYSEAFMASKGQAWSGPAGQQVFQGTVPYANSFGDVPVGQPLLYINSLMQVSFALNQGNFAATHHIGSGVDWNVWVRRAYDTK